MRQKLFLIIFSSYVALVGSSLYALDETPSATTCTVPGTVPITPATRQIARDSQIPDNVNCWNPNDKNTGLEAGEAKKFLSTLYTPGGCSSMGFSNARIDGIQGLNSDFAIRLAKLLKASQAAGYRITIMSAMRSPSGQACANPNGYGGNYSKAPHVQGIAADLIYPDSPGNSKYICDSGQGSPSYKWVEQHSREYGIALHNQIHNRVKGECNHVEPNGGVGGSKPGTNSPGEGGEGGERMSSTPCTSLYCQTQGLSPTSLCPMGSQALSNGMGGFTCIPAGMQCPANMISYQGQCFPFNNASFPQAQSSPSPSQAAPSTGGTAAAPSSGTTGTSLTSSSLPSASADLSSILSGTSANTSLLFTTSATGTNRIATSSVMNQLLNLTSSDAYYTSTNPSAASGTLAINSDSATDIVQLNPAGTDGWNVSSSNASADEDSATSSVVRSTSSASSVIHTTQPPPGSQTFTSRDLSESDSVRNTTTSPSFAGTFVNNTYAILEGLRQQLLRAYYFLISIGKK